MSRRGIKIPAESALFGGLWRGVRRRGPPGLAPPNWRLRRRQRAAAVRLVITHPALERAFDALIQLRGRKPRVVLVLRKIRCGVRAEPTPDAEPLLQPRQQPTGHWMNWSPNESECCSHGTPSSECARFTG